MAGDPMKFEVYCDETLPDLFTTAHPKGRYLMIGSLWLPAICAIASRPDRGLARAAWRSREIKWRKASPSKQAFYIDLIDLFMSFGLDLRFRCIAVDRTQMQVALHNGDAELGFYKFYYQEGITGYSTTTNIPSFAT
jgi:hypothetical protein